MKKLMEFLANHGETLIFSIILVLIWTVILPTMDAQDKTKHAARVAAIKGRS